MDRQFCYLWNLLLQAWNPSHTCSAYCTKVFVSVVAQDSVMMEAAKNQIRRMRPGLMVGGASERLMDNREADWLYEQYLNVAQYGGLFVNCERIAVDTSARGSREQMMAMPNTTAATGMNPRPCPSLWAPDCTV